MTNCRLLQALVVTLALSASLFTSAEPPRDQHGVKTAVPIVFDGLQSELVTGLPVHVVAPREENRVAFVLTNTTAHAAQVFLHVRVESFDGEVQRERVPLEVPARGTVRWPWPKSLFGRPCSVF